MQRTGGGTGFSFSRLRPKGEFVASTSGEASDRFLYENFRLCHAEYQTGRKRRGANMGVLRVDHPDIFEFISAKLDEDSFQNFNISVRFTYIFLEAVQNEKINELIHPSSGRSAGTLKAREVFDAIVKAAWQTGDPGLLFLDEINRTNPTPGLGMIEATNPCGEIPLFPYEYVIWGL